VEILHRGQQVVVLALFTHQEIFPALVKHIPALVAAARVILEQEIRLAETAARA